MAAYLKKRDMDCAIVDCFARPSSDQAIRDYLLAKRPAFVGLSCTTSSFFDGLRVSKLAKSTLPNIQVVFGGPHVSALKEHILEDFPVIDFVVAGEGEETLAELMERGGKEVECVKGLVYRKAGGEISFTGYRARGMDLDSLPFPAYEELAGYPEVYKLPIFSYPKAPNTSSISSRGCPYSCAYCDRSVFRRTFRYNSAEYLYAHLRYLRERFKIRHINFYDDQFTFNRERIEKFARLMTDRPLGITYNCAARAEHIDLDLLRQMKAAGCWMISLGIETGDEKLLAQHRRNADLELIKEKVRMIKKAGLRTKGLFMMGLPGETEVGIGKTMRYAFSLPLDDLNMSKFTPFPGSPLYERIHELGEFQEDWEKMDCMHFQFVPKGMVGKRLEELFVKFYRAHFMRPRVLWGYLAMLWRSPDSWFRFVKDLSGYFSFIRRSGKRYTDIMPH
jgi:radical SAM superfamily enzyme YgiQ (UPF0313 family)